MALHSSVFYGVAVPAALLLIVDVLLMVYLRAALAIDVSMLMMKKSWVQNMWVSGGDA